MTSDKLREFMQTPRDEAIEDAAGFIGIEPERLAAAIDLYEIQMEKEFEKVIAENIRQRGNYHKELPNLYVNDVRYVRYDLVDEKVKALVEAAKALNPYVDAIVCYASTMDEHKPNRLAVNFRDALAQLEGEKL